MSAMAARNQILFRLNSHFKRYKSPRRSTLRLRFFSKEVRSNRRKLVCSIFLNSDKRIFTEIYSIPVPR